CLVLDIHLPGMSGFEMYRRLALLGKVMPVMFITARDEPAARVEAEELGGAGSYLPKPFSGRDLLNAVARALGGPCPSRRRRLHEAHKRRWVRKSIRPIAEQSSGPREGVTHVQDRNKAIPSSSSGRGQAGASVHARRAAPSAAVAPRSWGLRRHLCPGARGAP